MRAGKAGLATETSRMTKVLPAPHSIVAGIVAGVAGGLLIFLCLAYGYANVLHAPGFTLAGFLAFDASVLLGKGMFTDPAAPAIGLALHFLTSIGWAIGYAYMAERQPQLVTRPFVSGAVFGLVIYFAMQIVVVAANAYHQPTPAELGVSLLAHIVFYGIPVAVVVARLQRAR